MNAISTVAAMCAVGLGLAAQRPPEAGAPRAGAPLVRVAPPGITGDLQAAIARGLDWLSRNQRSDGSWSEGASGYPHPVAMTALAGMAILASGSTPTRGPRYHELRQAVGYLLSHADPDTGLITSPRDAGHSMFGHGFATMCLASVYGMEEDTRQQQRIATVLRRAVALIASAQSAAGGWIYEPGRNDDEGSVTVTQIQALRACRMAGIAVDKPTIDRAVDYVQRCQNADGGIRYKLAMRGGSSQPAITAAGVAVFYATGRYDDEPFVERAVRFCKRELRADQNTTGHHFYAQYYWSQALYQRGGADWDEHFARIGEFLLRQQRPDGSWNGDSVGAAYGTAVALTVLQLPYALVPIYQR